MPRQPLPQVSDLIYHVVARTNNKEWFKLPMCSVWQIFGNYLNKITSNYDVRVVSFVLMQNHYHLLVKTPKENLSLALNYFQREVSRQIGNQSNTINHIFGGTFKGCLLQSDSHVFNCYKYVYRNPIAAGLEKTLGSYPYSTIQHVLRGSELQFPLHDQIALDHAPIPEDLSERELWLASAYSPNQARVIQLGLRRTQFSFPKGNMWRGTLKELAGSLKVVSTFRE